MEQINDFGDYRTLGTCAFCAGKTGTRDHCPSKIFLDDPFPENLPVVPACKSCNSGFSLDEEYLACMISAVLAGTAEPDKIARKKIAKILKRKPALRSRIEASKRSLFDETVFFPENKRVISVLTKLAQGHALYELHESVAYEPDEISFFPLTTLSNEQRMDFETLENHNELAVWPEVGSRAMQRLLVGQDMDDNGWIVVQAGMYRYRALLSQGIEVRIVINEYLGSVVRWH